LGGSAPASARQRGQRNRAEDRDADWTIAIGFRSEVKKAYDRRRDQMHAEHRDEKPHQAKRLAFGQNLSDCAHAPFFFSFFAACCGVGQTKWFASNTISARKPGAAMTGNKKSPARRRGF
jgi:hypothetical protein